MTEGTIGGALRATAARLGDREGFTYDDRRMTFREVDEESDAIARALLGYGIKRGDRVAIWMTSHSPSALLYFGVLKIGAVLVPLSTRLRPDELAYAIETAEVPLLFFIRERKGRTDYGDVLREALPALAGSRLRTIVDLASPPFEGTIGMDAFLAYGASVRDADLHAAEQLVQPRDEAVIMYTSGTTSLPKGARIYHEGMLHSVRFSNAMLEIGEDDVYLTMQPIYHSGGAIGGVLRPVVSGCRLVTHAYFDPGAALQAMEDEGVTTMSGLQPHYIEYCNHPTMPQRKLSIKRAFAICPSDVQALIREKMGITGLVSGYCMTETHLYGTNTALDDGIEVCSNTNGRPNPGVEVEIRDPDDATTVLPVGEDGEIFLRVPHPMLGYIGDPKQTAEVLSPEGWYRTGDRGVMRPDGNLVLLGRVRDMIRVGGENLSANEVESVLLAHPAVKQSAVVPAPDPRLGEIVIAFVECKPGASATEAEIVEHCRAKLAHFKVPRAVHFVTEWPLTGSGKVQKRSLLELV